MAETDVAKYYEEIEAIVDERHEAYIAEAINISPDVNWLFERFKAREAVRAELWKLVLAPFEESYASND